MLNPKTRTFEIKERYATHSSPAVRNPVEYQTENGFAIIRLGDVDVSVSRTGTRHYFIVRDPFGYELDITVDVSNDAVAEVMWRCRGRITLESSFWITCAESHLATYLWENEDYKGKVYFELDVSAKPNDSAAVNKFSSFIPRLVVGAGHHIEAGVNLLGNVQPGPDSTTIAPTIKWKVYDGKDNGWAAVIGDNLFIPVRNRAYNAGTYTYAMTQKTFNRSTRVGVGGYFFSKNVVAANANRAGGQFTFEQPLNKKVTIAADWFSGKHSAGYFSPGVVFKVGTKITGYASYSIGNQNASRGNHYSLLEFGYNFN